MVEAEQGLVLGSRRVRCLEERLEKEAGCVRAKRPMRYVLTEVTKQHRVFGALRSTVVVLVFVRLI